MSNLRISMVLSLNRVSKLLINAGKSVSSQRETTLSNKDYFPQIFYVFFVISGASGTTLGNINFGKATE